MITSTRLQLVPLSDEEARAIIAGDREDRNWANGYPTVGDELVAQHHLDHKDHPETAATAYQVVLTATGAVIGGIGFKGPPDAHGVVEVGYGIAPEHQGQGLATEALQMLLSAAVKDLRIDLVFAETEIHNHASHRVAEKAGMHLARTERGCYYYECPTPTETTLPPRPFGGAAG